VVDSPNAADASTVPEQDWDVSYSSSLVSPPPRHSGPQALKPRDARSVTARMSCFELVTPRPFASFGPLTADCPVGAVARGVPSVCSITDAVRD
jgi:hypothetical protein